MATQEQFTDYYRDYEQGYLIRDAQVGTTRAFVLTGLYPKISVPTKKINVINSTPIDKFVDKTGNMKKVAKGAEMRRIVGEVPSAGGMMLAYQAIEYIIENEDMLEPTFNLRDEIMAMSYVHGMDIEQAVYNGIVAAAGSEGISLSDSYKKGDWDNQAITLEDVVSDLIEIGSSAHGTPYRINWLAYGQRADAELKKRANLSLEDYTIPQNQFPIKDSVNFMNARHFYGGFTMGDGEIIGGDLNMPGAKIVYKNYTNPKMSQAPMPEGLGDFAPNIQLLMYDDSDKNPEPKTTIKVASAVGVYPVQKGAGIFYEDDIMTAGSL